MQARGHQPSVLRLAPWSRVEATPLPPVRSTARIVWIGGSEPLEYPEIPGFANDLATAGREVFLRTSGKLLRPCIHQFQPSSRFRFVLPFDGQALQDAIILEAIRVAKLSGFLVCALTFLRAPGGLDSLAKLHTELHRLDLDGYLIAPAARTPELDRAVADARLRLLNRRWRRLSEMLEFAVLPPALAASHRSPHRNIAPRLASESLAIEQSRRDCEEGAQA
jgi:hypothetical protein